VSLNRLLPALLFVVVVLSGCGPTTVTLWTDAPEIVTAVEVYNASQDEQIVELTLVSDVASALPLATIAPDVVVGRFIENVATTRLFEPLDRLARRDLDETGFYPGALDAGVIGGRQLALPVSFSLPLVYYRTPVRGFDEPIMITPEEIRSAGAGFNESADGLFVRVAYSPVWEPDFLYQSMKLAGMNPRQNERGEPIWESDALITGITDARAWVNELGGPGENQRFADEYLYDPHIQLVKSGRVLYGYSDLADYLAMSDERRQGLAFRWLGSDGEIPVLGGMVFAAIPSAAENRRGAELFLTALLSQSFQERVLASAAAKRIRDFGMVGGMSSLWRVNEQTLPAYFPALENRIPPADELRFPDPTPRHWGDIVHEVVEPWLRREVLGQPQSRDLAESVRAWLLQQED
jgi:ABC-type glycerol-3-phosphate transport system substrate-binding protein